MAASSSSERLTPLDLLMPRTYITALFTFRTTQTNLFVTKSLHNGLDSLANAIPWLSSRVCPTAATKEHGRSLEIRYSADDPSPTFIDKGTVDASYEALSAEGIPPDAIPADVWPLPMMIDEDLFEKGAPVFGASLFGFIDGQGVGLYVGIHHSAVEATGFADIVRLWAQYTARSAPAYQHGDRLDRLSGILKSDLQAISPKTTDDLFELHPEYSQMPPTFPTEFVPCICKIFTLSSAITRARAQRCPDLGRESSRLAMALGNAILYLLAHSTVSDLNSLLESPASFATTCDVIAQSQSPAKINSRHIAEVYDLVGRVEDYRTVFVGWDLFSSRDLTITSWANLDLYDMTFGEGLG
ncbi:transferase family-domain-containing protein [Xylaria digitata]|nr:transferase family-domain-containing protein [Xylaria digitata]